MPINWKLYPKDWRDISDCIRFGRAEGRCEQCGVEHGAIICRHEDEPERYVIYDPDNAVYTTPQGDWIKLSEIPEGFLISDDIKIVLTVAHLDHNPANNDLDNLKALCQRCHLNFDRAHNAIKAKRTRLDIKRKKTLEAGQQELLP